MKLPFYHLLMIEIMAELFVSTHMFARFLSPRSRYPARLVSAGIVCLLLAGLMPVEILWSSDALLVQSMPFILLFLFSLFSVLFCCEDVLQSMLFCAIAGYTVQHLSSEIHSAAVILNHGADSIVLKVITLFIPYALCTYLFARNMKKYPSVHVGSLPLLLLSGAALFVEIFFGLIMMLAGVVEASAFTLLLHFGNILTCGMILIVQFGLLSNRSLETELDVVSQMLKEKEHQYELSKETIDIINQKCHDLKHQIRTLRKGNAVINEEVIREIEQAVDIYDTTVKTGNAALDVILTEKSLLCESNGITLTCIADGKTLSFMAPADIYSLFGNALDNAIEAVSVLPEKDDREIGLRVQAKGSMLSIHVENAFAGTLTFTDGLPETSKEDKRYHGYGMKSMRLLAGKYNGFLTTSADPGIFNLDIVIPIPESEKAEEAISSA